MSHESPSAAARDDRRNRLVAGLRRLRDTILGNDEPDLGLQPDLPVADTEVLRQRIGALLARRESTSQRAGAAEVAAAYLDLDDTGRQRFLHLLAGEFGADEAAVTAAIDGFTSASTDEARRDAQRRLRQALVPRFTGLLHLFTGLDGGVKLLVDLRDDLLRLGGDGTPAMADLDHELKAHLGTLFDVGLLRLRRITWDSPAGLLEKLIEYEAVHAIHSWADLKSRLDSDRRCYSFFHPAMPDEPVIFVEIALTRGIAPALPPLLDDRDEPVAPEAADTAVFYSISNCQPGLAGVNLGNELIKQVVERLTHDLPNLTTFATLSPLPGFRPWLEARLVPGEDAPAAPDAQAPVPPAVPAVPAPPGDGRSILARLAHDDWIDDHDFAESIRPWLLAACARYVVDTSGGRVADPVGNFHLSNGASVERINWMANPSGHGLSRSFGLMVNYRYEPDQITENAEGYASTGRVARSPAVDELLSP